MKDSVGKHLRDDHRDMMFGIVLDIAYRDRDKLQ
jgi:hypothetical protein